MANVNTSPEYYKSLQDQIATTQGNLNNSPTAYANGVPASSTDLSQSTKLAGLQKTAETVRSNQLRNEWYGPQSAKTDNQTGVQSDQSAPSSHNWIVKGLSALQKPLNAIVGAEQYALGKGTESSLFGNINAAMAHGLTSGDVLKQYGVSRAVQIPLGFMLDVFQDPINWLTAGTEALVPRVGMGFVRGAQGAGIEGGLAAAKEGLVSGLARKVARVLPYPKSWIDPATGAAKGAVVGGAESTAVDATSSLADRFSNTYKGFTDSVGAKAISSADNYDRLTGTNVYDKLGKNIFGGTPKLGDFVESGIRSIPKYGNDIVDRFQYSVGKKLLETKQLDQVYSLGKQKNLFLTNDLHGEGVVQDISDLLKPGSPISIEGKLQEAVKNTLTEVTEPTKVSNTFENAQKLLDFAAQDKSFKNLISYDPEVLKKAYTRTPQGSTGVSSYDNFMNKLTGVKNTPRDIATGASQFKVNPTTLGDVLDKIHAGTLAKSMGIYDSVKDWTPFTRMMDINDNFMKLFRSGKVAESVPAHTYAWGGNSIMGMMMGIPIHDPEYLRGLFRSRSFLGGYQNATFLKQTFFNDINSWSKMMENDPNLFRQTFGFEPGTIDKKISVERMIMNKYGVNYGEVLGVLRKEYDDVVIGRINMDRIAELESKVNKSVDEESALSDIKRARKNAPPETGIQTAQRMAKESGGEGTLEAGGTSSMLSREMNINDSSWFDKMKLNVESKAKDSTLSPLNQARYKAANFIVNSMPNSYEKIDQTWKMTTVDFLSRVGVPEENLIKISRQVPIAKEDIVSTYARNGQKYYRLTPQKSSEVALETFMNYSAMPDFVKVMRRLPLLGSPFISFSYAMVAKTGKTLVNNPAFFNNIAFLMNEVSGVRSPQEKEALKQKYNEYLNSPTVIKLFGMWNTDAKTMLPYLTMNMLNSSQKNYDNSFPSNVVRAIDASPFMKDPAGQILFDYFIQTGILAGTNQIPEMQFGEPLYPSFDEQGNKITPSLGTKAFYAGRQGLEALIPGVASYTGLLGGMLPDSVRNAMPLFGWRQISNATLGKNTLGATTKENPSQKTFKAVAGRSGFPLYTLDPTTTIKKKP